MIMATDSAKNLKRWLQKSSLNDFARVMVMRVVLAFIFHHGRMSCSQAGGAIVSESVHRGQVTRFLARRRWQSRDFNRPLVTALLQLELINGRYLFLFEPPAAPWSLFGPSTARGSGGTAVRIRANQNPWTW